MITVGIAGLGWWGQVLVKSVQNKSDKIRVTKAVTRTAKPETLAFCAEQGIERAENFNALLNDKELDAIVLATPHSLHRTQIEQAVAGGKHVFCEKPLVLTRSDARTVARIVQEAKKVLAVGHNRRFHPAFAELRRRVKDGWFGDIIHVEGNMSSPGLWFYDPQGWRMDPAESVAGGMAAMGLHIFDGFISMMGPVARVVALSERLHRTQGPDETTTAMFRFKSGATGMLATSLATAWIFEYRVAGSNGWAQLRNLEMNELEFVPRDGEREIMRFEPFDCERAELEAFADAVEGKADYPISLEEATHSCEVLDAIVRSAGQEKWIDL